MKFKEQFNTIKIKKKSMLCVGLDPELEKLPGCVQSDGDAIFKFCREIIQSTAQFTAAYKINFAFFERFGAKGWQIIERLVEEIPQDCLSIADAKRGDIGNSARHYAHAIFGELNFDSVTVNPYMGKDSTAPFLDWQEKATFFLGLTSNPGATDFQYFTQDDQPLYSFVAENIESWNKINNNCGLVVGATRPEQLREIRKIAPKLTFLIPGVGAQGGSVETVVQNIGDSNALISASRSIIYASPENDFADAAALEAEKLQRQMAPFIE